MNSSRSNNPNSERIAHLIHYAHSSYEENPTEALSALMQALTLNGGQGSVDRAMYHLRNELGDDVADLVTDRHARMQRAVRIIEEMLRDESTFLYQRGKQDILRQAMEDGSSVVCTKCNAMVSAMRWQQHRDYWCSSIVETSTAGMTTTAEMEGDVHCQTGSTDVFCPRCKALISAARWKQHELYWCPENETKFME